MQYIKILSIPRLKFAHVFGADRYDNTLGKRKNFIEISYVKSGAMKKIKNGVPFVSHAHDLSCNTYHYPVKVHTDTAHEHHTVGFEVEFERSDNPKEDFIALPDEIQSCDKSAILHKLIDEIIELSESHDTCHLTLSGLILNLLGQIDTIARKPNLKDNYSYKYYADKAKSYISENIRRSITQKEIANHLNVTPQYLCNVFKSATGESIIKYVNKLKLKQIRILIDRENVKLNKATTLYGYTDPNYVSRLYKKYFGKNITDDN